MLVDIPKNIQLQQTVPNYDDPMQLPGYHVGYERAKPEEIEKIAAWIRDSKRPVIYAGGGIIASGASEELFELVRKTADLGFTESGEMR